MAELKTRPPNEECEEREPSQIDEQLSRYDCNIERLDKLIEAVEIKLNKILHEDMSDKEATGTVKPSELVALAYTLEELNDRMARRLDRLQNISRRIEL